MPKNNDKEVHALVDLVKRTVREEMAAAVTEARNQLSDAVKEAWDAKEHGTCVTCGWWNERECGPRFVRDEERYVGGDCFHDPGIRPRSEADPSCVHWSPSKAAHGVRAQWIGREPR